MTPCLLDSANGEFVRTTYSRLNGASQLPSGWGFDWNREFEAGHLVYALRLEGDQVMQGLVSVSVGPDSSLCEVHLAESARRNIGAKGRYKGVGAHLSAIACQVSFDAGLGGQIAFTAKTALIDHYVGILGAVQVGRSHRMVIHSDAARHLVGEYLDNLGRT